MTDENGQILQQLEYPFSWGVPTHLTRSIDMKEYNSNNTYQFYPLVMFMHDITSVCRSSNSREDFEVVRAKLKKCEDDLAEIKEKAHAEISLTVVQHVLKATKMHVFYKYNKMEEFESQSQNLTPLNDMKSIDEATLEACKSIAWTKYDLVKSIEFIRRAASVHPECDLWHFILGRELRRERRDYTILSNPSKEELDCFKEAYEISKNSYCGVFLAQAHKEDRNYKAANIVYKSIYETSPCETDVLLRLALGLLQAKDFGKAKNCLDKVAIDNSNHSLYLHYQGMYYMKQQMFREAVPFLESAITDNHLGVELDYLFCRARLDESFDTTNYVLGMINKYSNFSVHNVQHLQLELAVSYAKRKDDVIQAMEWFIKAIQLKPNSSTLKRFKCCVNSQRSGNVYRLLKEDFLPKVYQNFKDNGDVMEVANTLARLVDKNYR